MKWLIALLGLVFTALGGWAAIDPASFPAKEFPPLNEHLIHDIAGVLLTFGIGLLIAAWVTSWRTPVLVLAAMWNAFHAVGHFVDVDRAVTREAGVRAAVEISALAVVLALLAWRSRLGGDRS
jgi:hypothetical protein